MNIALFRDYTMAPTKALIYDPKLPVILTGAHVRFSLRRCGSPGAVKDG